MAPSGCQAWHNPLAQKLACEPHVSGVNEIAEPGRQSSSRSISPTRLTPLTDRPFWNSAV
eukprot:9730673-Karenia_brevis.AAC.1